MKTIISIRLSPDTIARLDRLAKEKNQNRSRTIEDLLVNELDNVELQKQKHHD